MDADLQGANLEGASLKEAKLEGAHYDILTKWPMGFDPEQAGSIEVNYIDPFS